jgi:hypothetical protein
MGGASVLEPNLYKAVSAPDKMTSSAMVVQNKSWKSLEISWISQASPTNCVELQVQA